MPASANLGEKKRRDTDKHPKATALKIVDVAIPSTYKCTSGQEGYQ